MVLPRVSALVACTILSLAVLFSGFPEPSIETRPSVVQASSGQAGQVVSGTIKESNPKSGELVIEADNGTAHRVRMNSATTVHSLGKDGKELGKGFAALGKGIAGTTVEGAHVLVHYVVDGETKTVQEAHVAKKNTVQKTEGIVQSVDHKARTVAVKADDGKQLVFHVTKSALVMTGQGVAKFGKQTGQGLTEGSKVAVQYTKQGAGDVAHFFDTTGCAVSEAPKPTETKGQTKPGTPVARMPSASVTHIAIPRGATSASFKGTLEADKDAEFIIGEEKGVLLLASVIAPEQDPALSVHRADTGAYLPDEHPNDVAHWIERLPETLGYLVVVHKTGKPAPFTLNLETPRELFFDEATSTTEVKISGTPNAVVAYVVPPSKSIVAELTSGPKDAYLTLSALDNGQKLLSAVANKRRFSGAPAKADDEVILRVNYGAQAGEVTLRVQRTK